MQWIVWIIAAYLIGSIPCGLLIGLRCGIDLRAQGSGNIGATNAFRILGARLGTLCFILDVAKGAGPVLVSGVVMNVFGRGAMPAGHTAPWVTVGLAAVLGHIFPIYLRFKGGKGVATAFGALAGLWPWMTLAIGASLVAWLITVRMTRFVSVASLAAAVILPLAMGASQVMHFPKGSDGARSTSGGWPFVGLAIALSALVIWKHRGNITRLRHGSEHRLGQSEDQ